jgi:hypothetical protein
MVFANSKQWVAAAVLTAASAMATQASAETICATARKTTWNVPNGGLVINRSSAGVVKVILDSVNEWGTHTAMSHGYDFWVSHSTAKMPSVQDSCSVPINRNELNNSGPGASAIRLPAMYVNYFGGNDVGSRVLATRTSGTAGFGGQAGMEWYLGNNRADDWGYYEGRADPWVFYPGSSNRGFQAVEYLWDWPLYGMFDTGGIVLSGGLPMFVSAEPIYRYQADDGKYMRYGYNRYLDMKNTHKGDLNGNIGVVCSGLPAFASWRSGAGGVLPHSRYSHDEKKRAINALWNKVHQECEDGVGGVFDASFWEMNVGCIDYDVCGRAADIVTNTFAVDRAEVGGAWKTVRDNSSIKPFSISPDCLAGRNGKCYATGGGSSPWAWDVGRAVTWSGSTAFSCWSN